MKNENKKREILLTPKGVAVFPYLTAPDTKFKKEGEYRVRLRLPKADAEDLMEIIDAEMEAAVEQAKKDNPKKAKKIKMADAPYSEVTDDDGKPTGDVEFNFKMPAKIEKDDGTVIRMRPAIFDAKGKPFKSGKPIYSGSTLIVAFYIMPFYTDLVGAGVSLRLQAVQVLDLKTAGERTAEYYGFDVEEGYEDEPEEDDTEDSDENKTADEGGDDGESDPDF